MEINRGRQTISHWTSPTYTFWFLAWNLTLAPFFGIRYTWNYLRIMEILTPTFLIPATGFPLSLKISQIKYFCTGYEFKYPFLSPECKIEVKNMVVKPLYKHFINIEHPTMCIIGVPRDCPAFALFDVQVTYFVKNLLKFIFFFF